MSICAAGKKGYKFLALKDYLVQNYFILKNEHCNFYNAHFSLTKN